MPEGHRRAPQWLVRWRRLALGVMRVLANLKMASQALWILTVFPVMRRLAFTGPFKNMVPLMNNFTQTADQQNNDKKQNKVSAVQKARCDHFDLETGQRTLKRYGNAHGRWCKCSRCGTRWRWDEEYNKWEVTAEDESRGSSSRLPLPSSGSVAAPAKQTQRSRTRPGSEQTQSRPRSCPTSRPSATRPRSCAATSSAPAQSRPMKPKPKCRQRPRPEDAMSEDGSNGRVWRSHSTTPERQNIDEEPGAHEYNEYSIHSDDAQEQKDEDDYYEEDWEDDGDYPTDESFDFPANRYNDDDEEV